MSPELKKRVLTAALGVPAILALIILGGRPGASLFAFVLSAFMFFEYSKMTIELPDAKEKTQFALGTLWLLNFAFFFGAPELELVFASFFAIFIYFLFTAGRHQEPASLSIHFKEAIAVFFGFVYLGFLPLYMPLIRILPNGEHWLILSFLIVWAADSGAYFSGLKWGKTKLYPAISPKKSWEGVAGGVASAIVITVVYKLTFFRSMSWGAAVIVPAFVAMASVLGDLCESFLKRAYSTKDSGSLLPGHGGFLDRFDGVLFGLPVMHACVRIFSS